MRTFLAILAALGLAFGLAAQPAPGKGKAPAGKAAQPEEEPKIEGMEIARGENGYLGLQIVDGAFKMNFYDTEKKPKPPDVARAVLRWDPKYKVGQERVVLNPGSDPHALSNPRTIRPPYNFRLFIVLIREGANAGEETIVVNFRA